MTAIEIALTHLHAAEKQLLDECPPPYAFPSSEGRVAFIINHAISEVIKESKKE